MAKNNLYQVDHYVNFVPRLGSELGQVVASEYIPAMLGEKPEERRPDRTCVRIGELEISRGVVGRGVGAFVGYGAMIAALSIIPPQVLGERIGSPAGDVLATVFAIASPALALYTWYTQRQR